MPEFTIDYVEESTKRVTISAASEEAAINQLKRTPEDEIHGVETVNIEWSAYEVTRDILKFSDDNDRTRTFILDLARDEDADQVRMYVKHHRQTPLVFYPTDIDLMAIHYRLGEQITKMKKEGRIPNGC